uniref:Uncharacterized protein n=1 Tax=Anguilla anguilla TaxID=7936 RepID=A0A0E9UWX6_ANGAN
MTAHLPSRNPCSIMDLLKSFYQKIRLQVIL